MNPSKRSVAALDSKVAKLIADSRNSLTETTAALISASAYSKYLDHLGTYVFWSGSGRRVRRLWPHQVAAISLGAAYLAADRRLTSEGNVPEAALIKMPTGAGKSGVIAILARCLSGIERLLVLTPREALTRQLHDDISWRFWQRLIPSKGRRTVRLRSRGRRGSARASRSRGVPAVGGERAGCPIRIARQTDCSRHVPSSRADSAHRWAGRAAAAQGARGIRPSYRR